MIPTVNQFVCNVSCHVIELLLSFSYLWHLVCLKSFLIVLSVFSSIYIEQNNYIGIYQTTIVFFVLHQLSGNYLNMQVVIYFPHLKTSDKSLIYQLLSNMESKWQLTYSDSYLKIGKKLRILKLAYQFQCSYSAKCKC
jgi:hypothetical protein